MLEGTDRALIMGNEAIARGLLESGCGMATSYPGTPASEILAVVLQLKRQAGLTLHAQWAINEKVAFEIAYAGSMAGLRGAVSMKQVGLNVAADPLMSAAYLGTVGGFVVISADDPGPHSSQTEQDSRLMAMAAKVPVLDPDSPGQARTLTRLAFELSERHALPVMLRPTTRVCHARQDLETVPLQPATRTPRFTRDPKRWAATPKFRLALHHELEAKLARLAAEPLTRPLGPGADRRPPRAVVVSGVAAAHARELLEILDLAGELALYQVLQPFPLHTEFIRDLLTAHSQILVIEESAPVMEMQLADRHRVHGKLNGRVPAVGELLPEAIEALLQRFAGRAATTVSLPPAQGRRPTLCAGCPHRASFFAIKKAAPRAIYTSDIGCYTLGLNLGAVDTVLCMGAAISQAAGFHHAFRGASKRQDVVATIGDSTFFHAGVPALIDAVAQGVRFLLVILDNRTTAMTGGQPTPACGGAQGTGAAVEIEALVRGCGVRFCRSADPYRLPDLVALLKEALLWSRENGPAVVIARHPCLLDRRAPGGDPPRAPAVVGEGCDGCGYCLTQFECPAIVADSAGERVRIDPLLCTGCGVCRHVCPKGALGAAGEENR
jgi:indolepyruvate ferredoxin oxidoreductase alpha subunit